MVDKTGSLQIASWGMLMQSDGKVKLLSLPAAQVPTIYHAEYAAGLLIITGLNLEGATIIAANSSESITLDVLRFLPASRKRYEPNYLFSDNGEEVVTLPLRLLSQEIDKVLVFATKKINIGVHGELVDVRSKAVHICDGFWSTVFRVWMPTAILWILLVYYAYSLRVIFQWAPVIEFFKMVQIWFWSPTYFLPLLFLLVFCRSVPDRVVNFFGRCVAATFGGLGRAFLVPYYGFLSLRGSHFNYSRGSITTLEIQTLPGSGPGAHRVVLLSHPSQHHSKSEPEKIESPATTSLTSKPRPPRRMMRGQVGNGHDGPFDDEDMEDAGANSVEDPEWKWPAYDQFEDKYGQTELKRRTEEVTDAVSPFRVIYRRMADQLWPDVVEVTLYSTALIKVIQNILPHDSDIQCLHNPSVAGKDLFVVLDLLKKHRRSTTLSGKDNSLDGLATRTDARDGDLHVNHLVRFMTKEYSDVLVRFQHMTKEKRVAWDLVWTFLPRGKKVVYNCDQSQERLAGVVSRNSFMMTQQGWTLYVELDVWDYDGTSYHKCQISRSIPKFDGERSFTSLAVRPIELEGVSDELDKVFLANGKRFHRLAMQDEHRFMHYTGPLFQLRKTGSCWQLSKENADGRVMIDLASFAKMNPGYPMGNAKPPTASGSDDAFYCRGEWDYFSSASPGPCMPSSVTISETEVSDESLIFAPAVVYGFSFALKQWGTFAINGFSDISFDTKAFEALVMEPEMKRLVYNLESQYIARPISASEDMHRVDPISSKGEGCIFLCYGPPGTGKTLTAESIAENMRRPLWALTVSELGTTPAELEKTLYQVLEIAAAWRAVLLLDEADVYLEKRTSNSNLTRNAMTGVFLRLLEYYRGVLFLTTNRIGTFDDAFRSRISMFLCYPTLSSEHKGQVWRTLFQRAKIEGATAEVIAELSAQNLNGREIRNAIQTAQTWAKSNGEAFELRHVRYVMAVLATSFKTLSDATKNRAG